MSTRSEVLFFEEGFDKPIHFYQHWDGYELPNIVADAVKRAIDGGRITDTPYFGRIVFSEMLRHSSGIDDNLSYGISQSENGWIEYTVEIHNKEDQLPTIVVNEEHYDTCDEFLEKYLKENGAFDWKIKGYSLNEGEN
jgi:hypothetical protein